MNEPLAASLSMEATIQAPVTMIVASMLSYSPNGALLYVFVACMTFVSIGR